MENCELKLGVSKFKNINGVTCYMNSILAILQQCPLFVDYLINGLFSQIILDKHKNVDDDTLQEIIYKYVTYQLYKLFDVSLKNNDASITPTTLRSVVGMKNPIWKELRHQDSDEFFSFLINTVTEELGKKIQFIPGRNFIPDHTDDEYKKSILRLHAQNSWDQDIKKEYSPVKIMFTGLYHNNLICHHCGNSSNSFETFSRLQVPIPVNPQSFDIVKEFELSECLEHLVKSERLDRDNKWACGMCGKQTRALKTMKLWKAPKILVIHIKRFLKNNYGMISRKIINKVNYTIKNLDLSLYMSEQSPYKDKATYNLLGANIHQEFGYSGNTNMGHYTSIVKNRYDNKWYLFDDLSDVKPIKNKLHLIHKNAYLLFYYRNN